MAMGILGQVASIMAGVRENVYIVPAGKVAVFNIFATNSTTNTVNIGTVFINNTRISTILGPSGDGSTPASVAIKSVIGVAGTIVQFQGCTGIVTGYEEDA
jgi:hypothetical protein